MDEDLLQVRDYDGEGFKVLVTFGTWRVAVLRYLDEIRPENIASMERHTQTDEVFVLTQGRGALILGGNGPQVDRLRPQVMTAGKIYNVRCNTWHTVLLSRDASVLIVENRDTGEATSEFSPFPEEFRQEIEELVRREHIE